MNPLNRILTLLLIGLLISCQSNETKETETYDVIVLGEGTGAVAAAIQSARTGAKTLLVNPLPWLGGMLTSAGVSATDGNHQLPAGLWGEFRGLLRQHYGGTDSLFTGWVSNTMFEPKVGAKYWDDLAAAESNLRVLSSTEYKISPRNGRAWPLELILPDGGSRKVEGVELVDGTDLGDVAAKLGVDYDLGMEAASQSGESIAPAASNDIIQDFTYAAILKDYGAGADRTIDQPANYDPKVFRCACQHDCEKEEAHPCPTMLSYGKLPNNKYMINWPIEGNDYYANMVELNTAEREAIYAKAKQHTLNFIYYIQNELGFRHLGLADDEFPTADGLPLMPYHREGRRIKGEVRLNLNHILEPFDYGLYRTGIAVGDYPIDHHHDKEPSAPTMDFPSVPSFNIPLGVLIPKAIDHLLVADKAMSVSNIVNGSSRLQPVILQVGQVAGLMAAMAAQQGVSPDQLDVREVQDSLLANGGYLMPYMDVLPENPHFAAIQRIGATGILRGEGIPYKWANQTRFYPDTMLQVQSLLSNLEDWTKEDILPQNFSKTDPLTGQSLIALLKGLQTEQEAFAEQDVEASLTACMGMEYDSSVPVSKACVAAILDQYLDPFHLRKVDLQGKWTD
ncbi:MAG: FAD-dependent oxidoreductase [Saprospiraceae bacterium]|nr:FAD-dependent oxidoreductase [Saprospiraceae bacterium]